VQRGLLTLPVPGVTVSLRVEGRAAKRAAYTLGDHGRLHTYVDPTTRGDHSWMPRFRLVMRSSPGDTPIQERAGWLFWADQDCGLHSDFSWSHLWSHSCRFRGVHSGLRRLGSGAAGPNRTRLIHRPQNSKAREGQPSAGSNPAATASLTLRRMLTTPLTVAGQLVMRKSGFDSPRRLLGRQGVAVQCL
jgi:hypothetical protein